VSQRHHTAVGVTMRSAESGQLTVPRTSTNYGHRSFAVQGPVVWNSLPADLRKAWILDIALLTGS